MLGKQLRHVLVLVLLAGMSAFAAPAVAGTSANHESSGVPTATTDLSPALAEDGTFVGTDQSVGTIDPKQWSLVSDLASGEPPRFAPAANATPNVDANWRALGSNAAGALDSRVWALGMWQGNLYVGGAFTDAAGLAEADYIVMWDGSRWSALGSNSAGNGALDSIVATIEPWNGALYMGGYFTNVAGMPGADYLARWDGGAWSQVGPDLGGDGAFNSLIYALDSSTDGLYVGGWYTNAAGLATADYLVRWDGVNWSALGSNGAGNGALNDGILSLFVSGTKVYAGGRFRDAANIPTADWVAVWDGSAWSGLGSNGSGNGALNSMVLSIAVTGTNVFVAGEFEDAAGIATADYVARWNGSTWSGLGSNGAGNGALDDYLQSVVVSGDNVYVGGHFQNAANIAQADYVARWDGNEWAAIGSNGAGDGAVVGQVAALLINGSALYVGGDFVNAAGMAGADELALALLPSKWSSLGSDDLENGALSPYVSAIAVSGNDLYVGGSFRDAAGIPSADYVAHWNGKSWSELGTSQFGVGALNGRVVAIAVAGSDVYVGGLFTDAQYNSAADYVARWDGTIWNALGSDGTGQGALEASVLALAVSGTNVYVGGLFSNVAGNQAADFVALWDGSGWSALGSNGSGNGALNSNVNALAVSGSDLLVGGTFTNASGKSNADYIARWNGSVWSALGSNGSGNGALNGSVRAVALSGTDAYAAGMFTNAAGIAAADYVARWNGSNWSALGSNGSGNGALGNIANSLALNGSDVYVAGVFMNVGANPAADWIVRWNGSKWLPVDSNFYGAAAVSDAPEALAVGSGYLFVGGAFRDVDGLPEADEVAAYQLPAQVQGYKPDGRIKSGTGALVGNNIYNADGVNQAADGGAPAGSVIPFTISIQNDGTSASRFKVAATGSAVSGYKIKYLRGTTDITAAVVAGTYQTASLAPGGTFAIKVKVKVLSGAAKGSEVMRLVTISAVADPGKVDAVSFDGVRR
jgi:hypothetical protein